MDYALAIRRNRDQLKTIVLALFALAGGLTSPHSWGPQAGETHGSPWSVPGLAGRRGVFPFFPLFLPRSTIALIMFVLRPAESAVRRLIVIVAQGLALNLSPSSLWGGVRGGGRERSEQENPVATESRIRQFSSGSLLLATPTRQPPLCFGSATSPQGGGGVAKTHAFPLFDPLKSFNPDSIWDANPTYESSYSLTKSTAYPDATTDQTPIDASHIGHRLNALMRALKDLPRQARRLKRWELKRNQRLAARKPIRFSPMRPGLPPGWRERRLHEVDDVLKECHRLALDRLNSPDSS